MPLVRAHRRTLDVSALRRRAVGSTGGRRAPDGRGVGAQLPSTSAAVSGGDHVLDRVEPTRAIIIATPGAEPTVEGGFAAAVVLDTWPD